MKYIKRILLILCLIFLSGCNSNVSVSTKLINNEEYKIELNNTSSKKMIVTINMKFDYENGSYTKSYHEILKPKERKDVVISNDNKYDYLNINMINYKKTIVNEYIELKNDEFYNVKINNQIDSLLRKIDDSKLFNNISFDKIVVPNDDLYYGDIIYIYNLENEYRLYMGFDTNNDLNEIKLERKSNGDYISKKISMCFFNILDINAESFVGENKESFSYIINNDFDKCFRSYSSNTCYAITSDGKYKIFSYHSSSFNVSNIKIKIDKET